MPSDLDIVGRILLTMLLSGVIGLERELTDKTAGLRTHISVALGACLFGIVSAYAFDEFGVPARDESSYQVDVTRVASTVVTGIGFLGGGAIIKHGATVRGLTTAGSMWVVAAIGLAVALGALLPAIVTTIALLVALVVLRYPVRWIEQRIGRDRGSVRITLAPGADTGDVVAALCHLPGVTVRSLVLRLLEERWVVDADVVAGANLDVESQIAQLAGRGDVAEVEVV